MFHYQSCGLPDVWLRNGYEVHETEYGSAVSIQDLESLHRAIGLHIVRREPTLTAEQVRYLRKEMDLPQANLARILGVSESTMRNWEKGRVTIDTSADRLLRTLYYEHVTGESQVFRLIEEISQLNRELQAEHIELEACADGWCEAA